MATTAWHVAGVEAQSGEADDLNCHLANWGKRHLSTSTILIKGLFENKLFVKHTEVRSSVGAWPWGPESLLMR